VALRGATDTTAGTEHYELPRRRRGQTADPGYQGPSASGEPATDKLVQALADEAEAGYDSQKLRRSGGRRPIGSGAARVTPVGVDPELEAPLRDRLDHFPQGA